MDTNCGLVVVDMQNAFCQPGGEIYVGEAERQLPAIADAIQLARSAAMPVIYTTVVWESADDIPASLAKNHARLLERWNVRGSLGATCWGARLPSVISPQAGDHVLSKRGFYCPGLPQLVVRLGLSRAFLTGTTANNCVYAAALALFEADVEVVAIEDCISSFTDDLKTPWLHNIARFLGNVGNLDDLRTAASEAVMQRAPR